MFVLKNAGGSAVVTMPEFQIEIPENWGINSLPSGGTYLSVGGWARSDTTPPYTTPAEIATTTLYLGNIDISMQILSGGVVTFNSAYVDSTQIASAQAGFGAAGIIGISGTRDGVKYVGLGVPVDSMFTLIYFLVSADAAGDYEPTPYGDETTPTQDADGNQIGGTGTRDRSGGGFGFSTLGGNLSPFGGASSALHLYVIDGVTYNHISGCLWGRNQSLFKTLWSNWLNYKFNPMAAVLATHALPAAFVPLGDTSASISIAGTVIDSGGGFCHAITGAGSQYVAYPANPEQYALNVSGMIDFTDFSGVEITVYVPYCGKCTVPVSACMGGVGADGVYRDGKIWVQFRCDIVTGNLCAGVFCRDRDGVSQLIESLTGNCAYQVPITGNDNGASEILGALSSTAIGAMTGNFGAIASGAVTLGLDTAQRTTSIIGNHGGSVGAICNQYCYAEFTYTETSNPANYDDVRGRPSDVGGKIGDFSGYTEFDRVDVDGIFCTDAERSEIENLLQSGVYIR